MSRRSFATRERLALPPPPERGGGHAGAFVDEDGRWDGYHPEKKQSFLSKFGIKIAGSIACAAVVSVFMHLPYIKVVILWICQIILLIFGRPHGADRLERLDEKVVHAIDKAKQVAHEHAADGTLPKAAGPLSGAVAGVKAVHEVAGKVKAVEEKAEKGAAKVAEAGHDLADAIKGAGGKAKDAVGGGVAHISEALRAGHEAKEKERRDRLLVAARGAGLTAEESWSNARLEAEVNHALDLAWRERFNARCPNPRCGRGLWLNPAPGWKTGNCIYCSRLFYIRAAKNLGPPPRPRTRY